MSVYDHDIITRTLIVRERLEQLRVHQTEERQRLHAAALQELLDAGYSTREAADLLGLSSSFVHRAATGPTETPGERPEFEEIDAAVKQYVLG